MAFNSRTYHANKFDRDAREALKEARRLKAAGVSPTLVSATAHMALAYARLARYYRTTR